MPDPSVPESAAEYRRFRRERLNFRLGRIQKQWKIYYRSPYGKAGFYILLAFAILTLFSPLLTLHNPYYFFAPYEDSHIATRELSTQLPFSPVANGTPLTPTASALTDAGSYLVYVTTSSGAVDGVGLGGSSSTPAGHPFPLWTTPMPNGSVPFPAEVFPFASLSTFLANYSFGYSNYLLLGTTSATHSTLGLAQIRWTGPEGPGSGTPYLARPERISLNGSLLLAPDSDSVPTTTLPAWGPFASEDAYTQEGLKPGYIYAVLRAPGGGIYLNEYYASPLALVWSDRLPGNTTPSEPVFVGSFFSPPQGTSATRVLIEQGPTMFAFAPSNGRKIWQANFTAPLATSVGAIVPFDYQVGYLNSSSVAFVAQEGAPGAVDVVRLSTGTVLPYLTVPSAITGLTTSYGSAGLPTYVSVDTPTSLYMLIGASVGDPAPDPVGLPHGFGSFPYNPLYVPNVGMMVLSSSSGYSFGISTSLGSYPIQWHIAISPAAAISAPVLLVNSATGRDSFAFVSASGGLFVYSAAGTDINPLPPSFHTPSGNIYPFGTNTYGNDLFSEWAASFPYDWAIGLAVAAGIMLISLLVAMFIGFVSGVAAAVVETLTLVLFLTPGLALLIVVASIAGPSFTNIILVLTFVGWPFTALTLIGVVKSVRSRTFIEASRVSGAGTLQILRRHMLPNMTPLLAYFTALSIGGAVVGLSTLQFLGVAPLTIPTWGGMLQPLLGNFFLAARAPWWIGPPTITLTAFVFAFIFVSRGLDEVVNPRIRRR